MYAVIQTGGKQYRVSAGEVVELEKLKADPGSEVVFEQVLMLGGEKPVVGAPTVSGAKVIGEVVAQGKGDKVMTQKYRRRKTYCKLRGHRQLCTKVKIKEIVTG